VQTRLTTPTEPIAVESAPQFEELLAEHSPVLVDFHAEWCGPCKMLEPTVADVAAGTSGTVLKVDVDAHRDLAQRYDVQGVLTLYLFVDGEPVERLVGVHDVPTLTELVESQA